MLQRPEDLKTFLNALAILAASCLQQQLFISSIYFISQTLIWTEILTVIGLPLDPWQCQNLTSLSQFPVPTTQILSMSAPKKEPIII